MCNLAEECVRQGEDVTLVVGHTDKNCYTVSSVLRDRFVTLKAKNIISEVWKLAAQIRSMKPDVLYATLDRSNISALAARFINPKKPRVIVRLSNTLSASLSGTSGVRRWVRFLAARFLYYRADKIVAPSEGVARDYRRAVPCCPRERVQVIYNPAITPEIRTFYNAPVQHPWFADNKEIPVILAVGRLHRQKDYPTLLKAFADLRGHMKARLVILGEGEERNDLDALSRKLGISDDIDLPGFVSNPYPYMKQADLFALSSQWEGLPNVLIEALGAGTAVVATDCPSGPDEILEGGVYGSLVPVGDYKALSSAMQKQLSCESDAPILMNRAEQFTAEQATQKFLQLVYENERAN